MNSVERFINKNPGKTLLIAMVLLFGALHATNSTATIEMVDGKPWVIAIDGKSVTPRPANRYDIELNWEYVEGN